MKIGMLNQNEFQALVAIWAWQQYLQDANLYRRNELAWFFRSTKKFPLIPHSALAWV